MHGKVTEIVYNWRSFLRSIIREKLKCNNFHFPVTTFPVNDADDLRHDSELRGLTLRDVLRIGSGSRFCNSSENLKFDHVSESNSKIICGNTCSLTITIPLNRMYTCNSGEFSRKVIFEDHAWVWSDHKHSCKCCAEADKMSLII